MTQKVRVQIHNPKNNLINKMIIFKLIIKVNYNKIIKNMKWKILKEISQKIPNLINSCRSNKKVHRGVYKALGLEIWWEKRSSFIVDSSDK